MIFKSFRVLTPVLITIAAIIGLALGPGSQPSFEGTTTFTEAALSMSPTVPQIALAEDTPPATETFAPPTLPPDTPANTPTLTATPTRVPSQTRAATPTRAPTALATVAPRVLVAPVLMYHYVSVPPPDADKYRLDLSVSPDNFRAQMDYLAATGYHPVRLTELADYLEFGAPLPDRPIVLTFDDGYTDNYANAFPVLKDHKFVATFFVIVDAVEENRWGYMNWSQLDEMSKEGMEIGSHTLDHPDLQGKSRAYQTKEIADSRQLITTRLGVPVVSFSYPAGKYDATTQAILHESGYTSAVVETQGARQSLADILEIKRIRIRGSYSVADFAHWLKYFEESGK